MISLEKLTTLSPEYYLAFWLFCLTMGCLFAHFFLLNRTLKQLHFHFKTRHNIWNTALIEASIAPLKCLVWLTGVTLFKSIVENHTTFYRYIDHAIIILYIILFCWVVLRFVHLIEVTFLESEKHKVKDPTTVIAITKVIRFVFIIIVLLTGMQTLGISISGLLAFGGISGIAVGFAAKDLLSNFFGGLMLYLDNPFKVGDWIRTIDKPHIEGTVEYIGWRQTRIRTFDRRPLHVPNALFANIPIENASRMQNRRIKTSIGLCYSDSNKLPALLNELRTFLRTHPDLDHHRTTFIYFNRFGPSSLDCQIYCFTKTKQWTKWLAIQEKLFIEIINIIEQHGASIAFPTATLHLADHQEHPRPFETSHPKA